MNAQPIENLSQALDRIESLLARQVACAKNGDYTAVLALEPELKSTLERASALPGGAQPELQMSLHRIDALRRELELILAQQRQELTEQLARIRRGKGTLRAYRNNSTHI